MNCEHCQTLLLDHLYGLLEGAEAANVHAHLEACPQCSAARAETARVQGLFARAAKNTFPNTKFEPPVQQPAPQKSNTRTPAPTPAVLPFPATRHANSNTKGRVARRVAAVLPWAVAAAVLLAIPGTVVPVLGILKQADSAKRDAEVARREANEATRSSETARLQRESLLSDAQMKLTTAEQTQTALLNKWVDEQKAALQAASNRKLTVDVLKPANVQPGAPNDFLLVVRDERKVWESRGTKMVAEVRTSDAVLFTQPLDHEKKGNAHSIRLPASVWSKVAPNTELSLVVAQVDDHTGTRTPLQEVRLAGPVFTTLLVTDKPAYRPGERLFFRSLTLDRITLRPPTREQFLKYELVSVGTGRPVGNLRATGTTDLVRVNADANGRVEPVRTADGQPVRGVGCGEFVLPSDLADGEYTLILRELQHPNGLPATVPMPVTRTIKVRTGAADNYAKQIGFAGASFVSGDLVEAWAELKFQDNPVKDAEVTAVAVEADGVPLTGVEATKKTGEDGRAKVRFTLPADVLNGDVRLKVTFRTPRGEEAVADRVPVVGRRLIVEFFPECGDTLVAGVPCKVYVRATTPAGQPVDISGVVTDGRRTLATVKTLSDPDQPGANRGLASFTFTPRAGARAWLKLDGPNAVHAPILVDGPVHSSAVALMGGPGAVAARTGFVLPEAKLDGVVMSVPDAITSPGQPIRVHLYSVGQPRTLVVGAYTRGRLSDTQKITVKPDMLAEVKLMAGSDPRGGVVRITAFEEVEAKDGDAKPDLKPLAERLVFRRAGEVLNLALAVSSAEATTAASQVTAPGAPPRTAFTTGTPLSCAISATDEKNNPVAAVLWAAVVNTGVAPGAKDRAMPTHFLLAGEVKTPDDLEYADFLLTNDPKLRERAGEALDLVLGTQGWRRFAEQVQRPVQGNKHQPYANAANPELARLLIENGQHAVWAEPTAAREYRKITETYSPLYEAAVRSVAQAKTALDATREEMRDVQPLQASKSAAEAAQRAAEAKTARAESAREPVRQFRSAAWYGIAGFAALALLCGGVSLARPQTRFPLGVSTLGSFGLAAFLFVAAGWGDEAKANSQANSPQAELALNDAERPTAAPAPRPVDEKGNRDTTNTKAPVAPPGGIEWKGDRGKVTIGGPPNFGHGGAAGGGTGNKNDPPPKFGPPGAGVGGFPHYPPPPLVPNPGRGPDAKGGYPPMPAPGGPLPVLPVPEMKMVGLAPPAAPASVGGWEPTRPHGVSTADLVTNPPSMLAMIGGSTGRTKSDAQAESLKKASDKVARFAHDRVTSFTESLDTAYGTRQRFNNPVAPDTPVQTVGDMNLTPEKLEAFALRQIRGTVTPIPPLVVREYAAPRPNPTPLPDAADTPDTILWQPVIVLPSDGKATLTFNLGNSPGGYQVVIAGHTADGRLGEVRDVVLVSPPKTLAPPTRFAPNGAIPPKIPTAPSPPPAP